MVVFGAGPIGQSIAVAASDLGASVLLLDRVERRLGYARAAAGTDRLAVASDEQSVAAAREWAGDGGPEAVFEATGVPGVVRLAVELVRNAGRVVVVGLSNTDVPLRVGDLAFKELDVLGVSCCDAAGFADAVSLVARREEALRGLVTHEFALEETHEAMIYAMDRAEMAATIQAAALPGDGLRVEIDYIDAVLARMPEPVREHALAAVDRLAPWAASPEELAEHERTAEFAVVRALAIEAYYSDFVAPGREGPGAWTEIDFNTPLAARLAKDWRYLGIA